MADLRRDDRGQVLLIVAFLLAAAFVALALVLNSVIYTENIATRSEEARGTDAIFYKADMTDGAEDLIYTENRNDTSDFSAIDANFRRTVRSMQNRSAILHSMDGVFTATTVLSTTEGRRIGQFNASRNFTADSGLEDWDLATDVEGTRSFWINITNSNELETESNIDFLLGSNLPFNVTVSDGTDVWAVRIYQDASVVPSETVVDVHDAGECRTGEDPVINLTAGTVDGETCSALDFGDGVSTPYTISFENAQKIQGNFSMVVETTTPTLDSRYDTDTRTPFVFDAIYSSTIDVTYQSADLLYETEATVIPGESDD